MKRHWWISAACVLAALMLMIWGFSAQTERPDAGGHYYALMIDDYGTDALQFKQGAQDAAQQRNASVSFLTCARNVPVDAEMLRLLDSLETAEFSGLILSPCGSDVLARAVALAADKRATLICLFETDAPDAMSVTSNDAKLGRLLGEAAIAHGGATHFAAFASASNPETALIDGLTETLGALDVIRCTDASEALNAAAALPAGTACFALNAELTAALASQFWGTNALALWGVDPGEDRVALLKDGKVQGLGMRMPYAQGYLAVTASGIAAVTTRSDRARGTKSPTRVVTRDTMYDSENVKLMFPLLQ